MVVAAEVDPEPVFAGCLAVRYAAVGQDHPARWLVVGGACQQDPGQAQVVALPAPRRHGATTWYPMWPPTLTSSGVS